MPLFEMPKKQNSSSKDLMDRIKGNTPPPVLMKKGSTSAAKSGDINSRINTITTMVNKYLGKYKDDYMVIRDEDSFHNYITRCIDSGYLSVDTETGGLDPLVDEIAGLCLYSPGQKGAYIPINHISLFTGLPLKNQISKDFCKKELQRIADTNLKIIMHNAKFDIRVIKNRLGVTLPCYWDTLVASILLNENEPHNLKKLHNKYILNGEEDSFSFDELFDGFNFQYLPVNTGYLYAARDPVITWELFKFQEPFLTPGSEECIEYDLERVSNVFWNIEMPLIPVLVDLEDTGIAFDFDLVDEFSSKYHSELDRVTKEFYDMISEYSREIESYRRIQGYNCKLEDPINIGSPAQIAILLYDIMKLEPPKGGRGTGEDVLQSLKNPICEKILEYREYVKHIGTYVDKLPNSVNPLTNRIHARFNAGGAATGRFSCISKNTMISCPDGDKRIQDITPGQWVYCYDNSNRLDLHKVINCWYTGNRKCIKLAWKSKYSPNHIGELICTPDHFIKTRKGWKMAKDLTPSDSILFVHRQDCGNHVRLSAIDKQGNEEEHFWIKNEWFKCDTPGFHIHHIDHNELNNSPDNLSIVESKTHVNIKCKDSIDFGLSYGGSENLTKEELIEICENHNWRLSKVPYDYSTFKGWLRRYKINYIKGFTDCYTKRRDSIDGNTQPLHYPLTEGNLVYALELSESDTLLASSYFGISEKEFLDACDEFQILSNYSITSITWLEDNYEVYDLEIEGVHNFIANELCVHNSSEPNLQNIPSRGPKSAVRKYFKATDSIENLRVVVSEQNNLISKGYTKDIITLSDGSKKHLEDLHKNDIIVMKNGKDDIFGKILSFENDGISVNFTIEVVGGKN